MKNRKSMRRHRALKHLSHDHNEALLLCWKIRTGLNKNIKHERINKYTDWFYKNHLLPHFAMEEKHIFPVLGDENELIKKAVEEHKFLKLLFESVNDFENSLYLIERELVNHIRFEERVLFNQIQNVATEKELAGIASLHDKTEVCDNWKDTFWQDNNVSKVKQ